MKYPNIGDRVHIGDHDPTLWRVVEITDRGNVVCRGPRLDELIEAPVEAVRLAKVRDITDHPAVRDLARLVQPKPRKPKRKGYRAPWE